MKCILSSRFLAHVEEMEDNQSILEPPDVELDNFPEIASFHESQDSYMREINQSNIYCKFVINITTPHIDNPACYQSNWPTQESYMSIIIWKFNLMQMIILNEFNFALNWC